jgi:predicted ATPase/transcriptional regulator with XRE-family HTH domain
MSGAGGASSPTFGARLRRSRQEAGLSQEELAERAGMSSQAIGALERGDRKRPYPATLRRLADALGLVGDERAAFLATAPSHGSAKEHAVEAAAGVTASESPDPAADAGIAVPDSSDLPRAADVPDLPDLPTPLTTLLGRDDDVAQVSALLQEGARLLTLTGPGGVGKTRLSLQIAAEARPLFADGVAFVPLAPLADAGLVLPTIAQALGVRDSGGHPLGELLRRALRGKRLLLVLDNCEHVLAGMTAVAALLEGCPRLVALATSRAPLRVRGEQEYPVTPLALPAFEQMVTLEEAARSPAVRLFVERAQAASPTFALTTENASAVAAICGRLDGLPLALELAAPRIKLLPPSALLARLHHTLPLVTGGGRDVPARQQTLRATIAWSYHLLDEGVRVLFRRLAVFAGGCTLEAAEAVCAAADSGDGERGEVDVLEGLGSLLDKSLLQVREQGGEPRFAMLETIREFGMEQLAAEGERDKAREQHARYFVRLAEDGLEPVQALPSDYFTRLEGEQDNLRAATEWAKVEGQIELGLRLVCAHSDFWRIQGHCAEGQQRAEEMLRLEGEVNPRLRSSALVVAGTMARLGGDLAQAIMHLDQALAVARQTGDSSCIATACQQLGLAADLAGDLARGQSLLEESLALMRAANRALGIATTTHLLASLAEQQGQLDQARALWEESLTAFRELGEQSRVALVLHNLSSVALKRGELERAKALLLESLVLAEQIGYANVTFGFLEAMAGVAEHEGSSRNAARFLAVAEVARAACGEVVEPAVQAEVQHMVEAGRAQVGEAEWNRAWQEGQAMPLEMAVALAKGYATEQRHHGDGAVLEAGLREAPGAMGRAR